MNPFSRPTDRRWSVPLDLELAVVTAFVAYALVLGSEGFRPGTRGATMHVGGFVIETGLPAIVGAFAGLVLLLFLPGYVFVAAVLPHRPSRTSHTKAGPAASLSRIERIALSFGMSVSLLAILGLLASVTPAGYSRLAGASLLLLTILGGAIAGTVRGHTSMLDARRPDLKRLRRSMAVGERWTLDHWVSVLMAISVIVALSTLTVALVVPHTGEAYTGFAVLSPTQDEGGVAASYSVNLLADEPEPFVLLVENRETAAMEYTLVVTEQRIEPSASGVTILEERERTRRTVTVPAGEDRRVRTTIAPTMHGPAVRLSFYLYRGPAPGTASAETAYRQLYLWVDVTEPESA